MEFGQIDWEVDETAEQLNTSLFAGQKSAKGKKAKKRKLEREEISEATSIKGPGSVSKKKKRTKSAERGVNSPEKVNPQPDDSNKTGLDPGNVNLSRAQKRKKNTKARLSSREEISAPRKGKFEDGNVSSKQITVTEKTGGRNDNVQEKVAGKKKRKRKCKKNKFKDYSKTEELVLGNSSSVQEYDQSAGHLEQNVPSDQQNGHTPHSVKKKKRKRPEPHAVTDPSNTDSTIENKKRKKRRKKEDTDTELTSPFGEKQTIEKVKISSPKVLNEANTATSQTEWKKKRKRNRTEEKQFSSSEDVIKLAESAESSVEASPKKKRNRKKKGGTESSLNSLDDQQLASSSGSEIFSKENKRNIVIDNNKISLPPSPRSSLDRNTVARFLKEASSEPKPTPVPKKTEPKSLLERSRERLNAARFRYINEQLYTSTGKEAVMLFRDDTEAFQVYHDGFQSQVEKWPTNPVQLMIKYILSKPEHLTIADFGCGDAKIAQSVPNKVHSFDLVALNDSVTVCDMAKVPLMNSSVDMAVFCLSLMGTNLASYLQEANRVLKQGGLLKVAEVESRFHNIAGFIKQVEKLGFKLDSQETGNKMFVMLDFRKKKTCLDNVVVDITLRPCLYKKR